MYLQFASNLKETDDRQNLLCKYLKDSLLTVHEWDAREVIPELILSNIDDLNTQNSCIELWIETEVYDPCPF